MELSNIILSIIILILIAVVIFISIVKDFTSFKKIMEWVLLISGFVSFYSLLFSVYFFFIKGVIEKGIIPLLTLSLIFIIPLTGLLAIITLNRIKIFIKNLIP